MSKSQESDIAGSNVNRGTWPQKNKQKSYKVFRPLTRKIELPASVLCPYLILVLVRVVALVLILSWRIRHPNEEAIFLWGASVACEFWFAFSWLLDQLPKLRPLKREANLELLKEKFESNYQTGKSDLPGIDVFVTTADPTKEPPLATANTILSVLAADYPPERLSCYLSDDGGAFLTYKAMCEVASFAKLWVPFCRKHEIEPRNPDAYFGLNKDPTTNKVHLDFVNDKKIVKVKYGEFKIKINGLSKKISETEETSWPGTWTNPCDNHNKSDHQEIIKIVLDYGSSDCKDINLEHVDIDLPMLVYLSREKRPGYDHHKKAGAMNALVRASAIMSNGAFILNLDCDHYIYNSQALREAMCFMMDGGGERICYVQFPQRFEGIDPSDRYANKNVVFFDVNMRCLDGLQGPFYVGTGCLFRRVSLYGIDPPYVKYRGPILLSFLSRAVPHVKKLKKLTAEAAEETQVLKLASDSSGNDQMTLFKIYGECQTLISSIGEADFQGRPLADHPSVKNGREPGKLAESSRVVPDENKKDEARKVITCWFEDDTEWGDRIGWIYGSLTEDVLTGYKLHNRGWKSVYCVPERDAFRGTAPINLTDRLHQVLRWATGSVEIFFSSNNALLASPQMKLRQRIAYINLAIYPFTSIFLTLYCFLPAISLFSGKSTLQNLDPTFLVYLLTITVTLCMLALLEIKWSGISLEQYWRNEQFWLMSGTSAHLVAVLQGLLKAVSEMEIKFNVTAKATHDEDEFADLYTVKWTTLMIPHMLIMVSNVLAIAIGFTRAAYSTTPLWGSLIGGVFFSLWVLAHLYPFVQGLKGKGDMPGIVFIWSGLIAITISLIWVA